MQDPISGKRLRLQAGQGARVYGNAGTVIVCTEGALELALPALADGVVALVPRPRVALLHAGESWHLEDSGPLALSSRHGAGAVLLPARAGLLRRLGRAGMHALRKCAILISSRRGVEQSGSSSGS